MCIRDRFKTSRNFVQFDTTDLERGDIKTRYEAYRIALGRAGEPGWMTPNEIRLFENQPAVEGGDSMNDGKGSQAAPTEGLNDAEPIAEPAG